MNQLQFEFGIIPTKINKQDKLSYIETLIETRERGDIGIFRNFMLDEHIKNLEHIISNFKSSISSIDVPVNVSANVHANVPVNLTTRQQEIISKITQNSAITIRQLADSLLVNEKTIKRDIASLKKQGVLTRMGSDRSGHWLVNK